MPAPDRKGRATRTPEYIHPPLSVVIRLQPKGGLSACIRFDQKSGTKNPDLLSQIRILVRNDRENNTIRGFRFLVELSFGIWCSWVQSGCKTRRIWCTHSFRFAVISERTMARGRKKKFSDYIRTEVARIYRLLHNVGTLRRVPIFHFGCIFIGLTFLCP